MPPYTMPVALRADYTGEYVSDEIEAVFRIAVEGEKLMLKRFKYPATALEPAGRDVFLSDLGILQVHS